MMLYKSNIEKPEEGTVVSVPGLLLVLLCILLSLAVFLLTGCTEGDVLYRRDSSGVVVITPSESDLPLPRLVYHFYDAYSGAVDTLYCDGNSRFCGALPLGLYRVVATNRTDDVNVHFRGMDSHETAMATAYRIDPDARMGTRFLAGVDSIYVLPLDSVLPHRRDTVFYTAEPQLLTKYVKFTCVIDEKLTTDIASMRGVLSGVYPSVQLYTGLVADSVVNPTTEIYYMDMMPSGNDYIADATLFGICHPQYGKVYRNELELFFTYHDSGRVRQVNADLTQPLSEWLDQHKGVLPPISHFRIAVTLSEIGLEAEVVPWGDSGTGSGEVSPE